MGRFLPADFSQGDPNSIGGYHAAHGRPPAFAGSDGASYSVEIAADPTGDRRQPFAAYLLFIRWREHDPVAVGHLETGYMAFGESADAVIAELGQLPLQAARERLDALIAEASGRTSAGGEDSSR